MNKKIKKVGVIGAGQMGNGIAHVCALAGHDVYFMDIDKQRLRGAMQAIEHNMDRQVSRERIMAAEKKKALKRIVTGTKLDGFSDCGLVVEAVTEDEQAKKVIYKDLCPVLAPDCLLATNTSSISITRLGAATDRPTQFMGMHFMNPVPVMKLVEVIRAKSTSDSTFDTTFKLAEDLNKIPVLVNDFPGFVSNRILLPMLNEAMFCVMEGVAEPEAIDTVMKLGMSHPMGPLTLADFIGLDTCLAIMEVLHRDLNDNKYRPCPLLKDMVKEGKLGRKSGEGFYKY